MRCVSPVGSRSSSGLMALPAGVPSSDRASAMASRRPSAREALGRDRRAECVAVLEQPLPMPAQAVGFAVVAPVEAGRCRAAPWPVRARPRRAHGLAAGRCPSAACAPAARCGSARSARAARVGAGRQEGAEVGGERRAQDLAPAASQQQRPHHSSTRGRRQAAVRRAGVAIIGPACTGSSSISERSPPASCRRCCARRRPGPPPRSAAPGAARGSSSGVRQQHPLGVVAAQLDAEVLCSCVSPVSVARMASSSAPVRAPRPCPSAACGRRA
jgi:hypothetical protein